MVQQMSHLLPIFDAYRKRYYLNTKRFAHKVNERFYYGWVIVAVAAIASMFSSAGQTYSISAFIDAYINEFGFSRTDISMIYSVATFFSGMLMIVMGKMVDRFGEKMMLVIVGLMLALTTLFNSFVTTIPMLAIGFFFSRYFGQGSLIMIPGTLVPQWFKAKRGLAMSILKFGVAIASFAVPLINVYMIQTYGWQTTWRLSSLLLVVVFLPLILLFVINTPEEIGLRPDNIELKDEEREVEALEVEANSWHVTEAIRNITFWKLAVIAAIGPMISTGIVFHVYSILGEKGLSSGEASIVLSLMAIPGFIFSLISGYLIDKIGGKPTLLFGFLCMGGGVVLLVFAVNFPIAVVAILLYGIGQSIFFVSVGVMWPNFFGRKYLGSIQGLAAFFTVSGSAFGPLPFGMMFDKYGNYNLVLMMMVVVLALGCWITLTMKKPVKG